MCVRARVYVNLCVFERGVCARVYICVCNVCMCVCVYVCVRERE